MLLVNPKTPLSSAPELMAFASLQSARPFIESGRLKVLAVTGTQRMDALPKMATMVEQGLKDEVFQVTGWLGMSAPAKTPPEVVNRLATERTDGP